MYKETHILSSSEKSPLTQIQDRARVTVFLDFGNGNPPTTTAQEKRVSLGPDGKPRYYDTPALAKARGALMARLERLAPDAPMEGPLSLTASWVWRSADGKSGWRDTKPDTDNIQKLLKDCMTKTRYWIDDAQVCDEHIMKFWGERPGITITVEELGGEP